ncbi:MAG: HEAT repeat domain-containing protein [Candidatus Lernaella stagnicola]|nr:HEAT repeat domain-containing protein [Candidatus Lernaella stagnicola]
MDLFEPTPGKVNAWAAKGNVKKLLGSLTSSDAVIRELSVEGLASIGSPEVLQYCRENADSADDIVRWDITRILGLIGTAEAIKILETVREKKINYKPQG